MTPTDTQVGDQWSDLERLALAAFPHKWEAFHNMCGPMGVMTTGGTPVCHLAIHGHEHDNAAFIAAANPATVLELIAAARSVGIGAADETKTSPHPIRGEGELLPCPFCGGAAGTINFSGYLSIGCPDCGASPDRKAYLEEADATAAWNRRAHPPTSEEIDK